MQQFKTKKVNKKTHQVQTIGLFDSNNLFYPYGSPQFIYIDLLKNLSNFMIFMFLQALPKLYLYFMGKGLTEGNQLIMFARFSLANLFDETRQKESDIEIWGTIIFHVCNLDKIFFYVFIQYYLKRIKRRRYKIDRMTQTIKDYTVSVTNIPPFIKESQLRRFFSKWGVVSEISIIRDINYIVKKMHEHVKENGLDNQKEREKLDDLPEESISNPNNNATNKNTKKVFPLDLNITKESTPFRKQFSIHPVYNPDALLGNTVPDEDDELTDLSWFNNLGLNIKNYEEYPAKGAFITFEFGRSKSILVDQFKNYTRYNLQCCRKKNIRKKWRIQNHELEIKEVDNPEATNFENLFESFIKHWAMVFLKEIINIILHFIVLVILIFIFNNEALGYIYRCKGNQLTEVEFNSIEGNSRTAENIKCYCQGLAFTKIFGTKYDDCSKYANQILMNFLLQPATSQLLIILTEIHKLISKKILHNFLSFNNHSDLVVAKYYQYLRVSIINMIIIPVLVWGDIYGIKPSYYINKFLLMNNNEDKLLTDFNRDWYLTTGIFMTWVCLFAMIIQPITKLLWLIIKMCYKETKAKRCQELHKMQKILKPKDEFEFDYHYVNIILPLFLMNCYSSALPLIYAFCGIGYKLNYWIDKYYIAKFVVKPKTFRKPLFHNVIDSIMEAVLYGILLLIWILGSPGILAEKYLFNYYFVQVWASPIQDTILGKGDDEDTTGNFLKDLQDRLKLNIGLLFFAVIFSIITVLHKFFKLSNYKSYEEKIYLASRSDLVITGEFSFSHFKETIDEPNVILSYNLFYQPYYAKFMPFFGVVKRRHVKEKLKKHLKELSTNSGNYQNQILVKEEHITDNRRSKFKTRNIRVSNCIGTAVRKVRVFLPLNKGDVNLLTSPGKNDIDYSKTLSEGNNTFSDSGDDEKNYQVTKNDTISNKSLNEVSKLDFIAEDNKRPIKILDYNNKIISAYKDRKSTLKQAPNSSKQKGNLNRMHTENLKTKENQIVDHNESAVTHLEYDSRKTSKDANIENSTKLKTRANMGRLGTQENSKRSFAKMDLSSFEPEKGGPTNNIFDKDELDKF